MKIIVDQNVPLAEELFAKHGDVYLVEGRRVSPEQLEGAAALICRSVTKVDKTLLENSAIEFVGSCTIGVDHIDADYLHTAGVAWAYAPGCNAQSVVEYVSSCLAVLGPPDSGLTASVIGCGAVGSGVYAELETLGYSVQSYDPFLQRQADASQNISFVNLDQAMHADLVCLHTPLTRGSEFPTARMIQEDQLSRLKEGAIVISAGRGGVIDETALLQVTTDRPDIRWVLDVWDAEPNIDTRVVNQAAIATPHIAGYSLQGKQNGTLQIYRAFCEHFGFSKDIDIDLDITKKDLSPPTSLRKLLLSVYDPRADNKRLRAALKEHPGDVGAITEEKPEGKPEESWFDTLRKQYPVRLERSRYRADLSSLSDKDRRIALALGFSEKG